jgi:hypothetical protein
MAKVTHGVSRWIAELERLRNSVLRAAFITVLEEHKNAYHELLVTEAEVAISLTQEFDLPIFREPLISAIRRDESIVFSIVSDVVVVEIDLDNTAGRLEDYISAVESVRQNFPRTLAPVDASRYWRYFLYGQARDGLRMKKRRKKGQRGRTPSHKEEGTQRYFDTIQDRIASMSSPAPWWSILNDGNAVFGGSGTPYPNNPATHFVDTATTKILLDFSGKVAKEQNLLFTRLQLENYGGENILQDIYRAIEQLNFNNAREFIPGHILQELLIKDRLYKLYITRTGRLGLALR